MIKSVIFDLDNTILDFIRMKRDAISAAVSGMIEAGLEVDPKEAFGEIMQMYAEGGWENQKIFNEFLTRKEGTVNNKLLVGGVVAYRRAREASLQVYPNVNRTLLELLKMGIRLAVVSDAPSREAWMRIYYLNLHHVFDVVITFDETGVRKPSPVPFQLALDRLKVKAEEAIMIGDWPERDVVGAKQLGIRTVFARYGDTFGTVHSGADWDVKNVYELVNIVKTVNG